MPYLVPDYETASACDLKAAGADAYSEDPTTEVLCLVIRASTGERVTWIPGQPRPEIWERALREGWMFVAHNCRFERAITRNIMVAQWGWPDVPLEQWHDTLARCANLVIPQKLEKAAGVLGLVQQKDMEGSRLTLSMSKVNRKGYFPERTPAILTRIAEYCAQDTETQFELHQRIGWLSKGERAVWLLNQRVNDRGIKLDMPLVRNMKKIVDEASAPLQDRFIELTGFGINQGAKVKEWITDQGVEIENLQKETIAKLLGKDVDGEVDDDTLFKGFEQMPLLGAMNPEVREALEIKQLIGSSSIKKLDRMLKCVGSDGRAHGLLQYHGTGPGRQAGRLFQPHNFPRGTIKGDQEQFLAALNTGDWQYVQAVLGPPVETVVSSLRYTMVADDGRCYVSGDYSGIQARVVLALAGQWDKVKLMASGADVYCDMASQIYKETVTKKDTEKRQTGKNSVLGLGFQMGAPKFHWKYCPEQPLEFAQLVVNTYRKEWAPGVPKVWYGLQDAAVRAVWDGGVHEAYGMEYRMEDRWLTCRLPSGRKMWYFDAKPIRKAMPWDKDDIRQAFQYRATKTGQLRTIDAFGGQLTENVVMGIERDLMTASQFKCEREGMPLILEVHDENLTEPLIANDVEERLRQIMVDIPPWAIDMGIPVAVDVWSNDRYRK